MDDPYYLRKANIDQLDLSKFEKDYTADELSQVREALRLSQQQHQEGFDKLPITQRAKYHAADVMDYVEQNPETFLAVPTAVALLGAGKAAVGKVASGSEKTKQVFGSLRDMMSSKADDGLFANQQAEKAAAQQAELTAKEISAQATPTTNVDVTANVGKPLSPTDVTLVEQGEANAAKKSADKDVTSAKAKMEAGIAKGLPPPTLTTGTGKPAYPGAGPEAPLKSSYASIDDLPTGLAFVPGAQYADVHRQGVGQELYTKEFSNRPFSQTYRGTPASALEVNENINRSVGRMTRDELIASGVEKKDIGKNVEGIFKRIGIKPDASKLIRVAGIVGAATAIPNLANAREVGSFVGESLLPLGATPSPLESGKIPAVERKEQNEQFILNQPGNRLELEFLQKNKSPSEANKIREQYLASAPMTDYERASRVFRQQADSKKGIAPPSMR